MTHPETWPDRRQADRQALSVVLRRAASDGAGPDAASVVSSARAAVERLRPSLPAADLAEVGRLADLVSDKDWVVPPSATPRVVSALQHFADTGAMDLVEMIRGGLRHELDGYERFAAARERLRTRRFGDAGAREQRLAHLRRRLRARIQTGRYRDEHGWLVPLR